MKTGLDLTEDVVSGAATVIAAGNKHVDAIPVSVYYETVDDGSATPMDDYQPTSGTLTWAAGDTENPYAGGSGPALQFTATDNGRYDVSLTAEAAGIGAATTVQTVTVDNVDPSFEAGDNETLLPEVLGVFSRTGDNDFPSRAHLCRQRPL